MKTQEVKVQIIEAEEGHELYRISDPSIYGKKFALGINDSPENYGERPETCDSEQTIIHDPETIIEPIQE